MLVDRLRLLHSNELSSEVASQAMRSLPELFGAPDRPGVAMAVRAVGPSENPATIAGSLVALIEDLTGSMDHGAP